MNALENLYSRRSIRSYTGEAVTEAELQEILKAAYAAPVGRAQYGTLHLTVISNRDYLSRWESHMGAVTGNPGMHPFYGAPHRDPGLFQCGARPRLQSQLFQRGHCGS